MYFIVVIFPSFDLMVQTLLTVATNYRVDCGCRSLNGGPDADCPSCPRPRHQSGRYKPGLPRRCCHPATATITMGPRFNLVMMPCCTRCPPSCCQRQAGRQQTPGTAATVTATMRLFVVASVASPLVVDAMWADNERRACATAAQQCRRHLQMRDHGSIPTIGCQSCSPAPLSPPPHDPPIPFVPVRAPLARER